MGREKDRLNQKEEIKRSNEVFTYIMHGSKFSKLFCCRVHINLTCQTVLNMN